MLLGVKMPMFHYWDLCLLMLKVKSPYICLVCHCRSTTFITECCMQGRKLSAAARENEDPMDLLDPSTSRAMLRTAGGGAAGDADEPEFRMEGGRMIVEEPETVETVAAARKRKRGSNADGSEDSDFEDLQRVAALRISGRGAKSTAPRSTVAKSAGGRTSGGGKRFPQCRQVTGGCRPRCRKFGRDTLLIVGGCAGRSVSAYSKATTRGKEHSGERFAARKGGAGGDVKGKSKLEPYAYWPLDRGMLNRRPAKKARASKGLTNIVAAAKAGAAKGRKAAHRQKRR